jgi:hypothetical protein
MPAHESPTPHRRNIARLGPAALVATTLFAAPALPGAAETVPRTPQALQAALAQRRRESPPLAMILRVVRGGLQDEEETEETLVPLRWQPEVPTKTTASARMRRLPPLPAPMDELLASLDPPFLRPGAFRIREMRFLEPPAAPRARPTRSASRRPPRPGRHIVVGPAAPPPRRPLPTEYDLARPEIRLAIDHPLGAMDATIDPATLHLVRLTWGAGSRRVVVIAESVRIAGEPPRPQRSGRTRERKPPSRGAPPARCLVHAVLRPVDAPDRAAVSVEGLTAGLADGSVVEIRVTATGDEIERGAWHRGLGRKRCAVRDGRFATTIETGIGPLAAGRAHVAAFRLPGGEPLAECRLPLSVEAWRRALLRDLRAAHRFVAVLPKGRTAGTAFLDAFARTNDWHLLPATRRALGSRIRMLAAGAAAPDGTGGETSPTDLRDLLAREVRWAIVERAAALPHPLPARDAPALRWILAEAPPLDRKLDASMAILLDDTPPETPRESADAIAALRTRLRTPAR